MTKEQKAQQAQTIERWSHSGYEEMTPYDDGVYVLYDDHKASEKVRLNGVQSLRSG